MTAKKQGSGGFKSSPGTVFGTLEQVFDDVWWVWGTVRFAPGIVFPRNMTIVREKGELVLIHTVMMPPDQQAKIEALGPIKHVVRLGAFHGMDDAKYVERYGATMWAPPDVDSKCKIDRELVAGGATAATRFLLEWRGAADPKHVRAIDTYWICTAEHGLNASTFAARVVASTGADCAAALSSAVGALSGPLHGGAPARVLPMLDGAAAADSIETYVKDLLDGGGDGGHHRRRDRDRQHRDADVVALGSLVDRIQRVGHHDQVVVTGRLRQQDRRALRIAASGRDRRRMQDRRDQAVRRAQRRVQRQGQGLHHHAAGVRWRDGLGRVLPVGVGGQAHRARGQAHLVVEGGSECSVAHGSNPVGGGAADGGRW